MTVQAQRVGRLGEDLATQYLKTNKYKILYRNYRTRFGEIDIIALATDGTLTFIEVKARIGVQKGMPYEAVNYYKLQHLKKAIDYFLLQKDYRQSKLSIAVISIILKPNLELENISFFSGIEVN